VAVYSEADQYAPFVSMADENYLLGPSRVNESYLNADKIIEVAKKAEVDAVHPGYGFLSENATFAKKCFTEGLIFIGPSSNVIEMMGSKIASRKAMQEAGIPVIPGTDEAVATEEEAIQAAQKIGYPIMLKASSGGGGIGMQVVYSDEELGKAIESNSKRNVNEMMGSKIASRKAMQEAGIPVIPGTDEAVATEEEAIQAAQKIGYPIMLKASSGGGGIGMQVVYSDEELGKAFESNSKR